MRFSVSQQVFQQFPDFCVGGVIAAGIDNTRSREQAYKLLQEAMAEVRAGFGPISEGDSSNLTSHPYISAWREAFRKAGIKPAQFLTSVEALLRRVLKGSDLPSISPAVDLYNALSLRYVLPIGGHDLDRVVGELSVRLSHADDIFSPPEGDEGQIEKLPPGEIVYADAAEVRTRRWVWREGRKTRVDLESRNVFFPLDGFESLNGEAVQEATDALARFLEEYLGATTRTFYINKKQPFFDWEIVSENKREKMSGPTIITGVKRERDKIDELLTRGVAEIVTREELEARLRSGKQLRVKLGIDPTGPDIHIGRSVTLHKLRQFQELGHKVVLIIGQFTGQIGDASDKTSTRPMLTPDRVAENMKGYRRQIGKILDESLVEWRNNLDWFGEMPFKEGIILMSNFTVAQMIERENFRDRWQAGKPISLQEITYPVLQGYDSVMVQSDVEIGGTDQLFNMMAGRILQERYGQPPQSVLCNVMINGFDGRKMSTSQGNGLFINEPPKDMYAKMLKTIDELILEYFEVLTKVSMPEIEEMKQHLDSGLNPLEIKKKLAYTMTEQYYGPEAAKEAEHDFEQVHQRRELPDEMPVFTPEPGVTEIQLQELLVKNGLATSNKDAQRTAAEGGIKINGEKFTDAKARIALHDDMIIQRGNRHFLKIKLG
jgi:tyrosyl-tRNA synthetase